MAFTAGRPGHGAALAGERQELANRRQDIAQKLRPLLAAWEKEVDSEAKAGQPTTASQ